MTRAAALAALLALTGCTSVVAGEAAPVCADPDDDVPLVDGVTVPVGTCLVLADAGLADEGAPSVLVDGRVVDFVERDDETLVVLAVSPGETVVNTRSTEFTCDDDGCRTDVLDEDLHVTVTP